MLDHRWSAVAPTRSTRLEDGGISIRKVAASTLLIVLVVAVVVATRNDGTVELGISGAMSGRSHASIGRVDQLADATPSDRFDPTTKGAHCYACTGGVLDNGSRKDEYHVARLVGTDNDGSRSLCGRAEIKHDGKWGSVCYEGWSTVDAQVFCKTMGLAGGSARYNDGLKPTWDDTAVTHTAPVQAAAEVIWMDQVSCQGSEGNILDCPFGGKAAGDASAWINYDEASVSNCDHTGDVGLCCDVSSFCPDRSHWRPDQHDYVYQEQMFMGNMKPDQRYPEMIANCKCDAGFYMIASGVYGGRCEECMENACSPVGSVSVDQCSCLPGFFMSDGQCAPCPANSCSPAGSTSLDACKCAEGFFFDASTPDAPACTSCPPFKTSHRGASSADECSMDCGLPPPPAALGAEITALSKDVAAAERQRQTAMRNFEAAVKAKQAAVTALNKKIEEDKKMDNEKMTLGKLWRKWFMKAHPREEQSLEVLAKQVSMAEQARADAEASFRSGGERKASLLREMTSKLQEKDHEEWVTGNEVKECHPMKQSCYGKCRGSEPSNPCEPWPSCYPKPCSPWPGCMYGPTGLHTANLPKTEADWRTYEAKQGFPEACKPKYEGLVEGWTADCSEKLARAREAILAEVAHAEQSRAPGAQEKSVLDK